LSAAERSGRLHRNFQGYTDDASDALIGLGASAISSLPDLFYQNTTDTGAYRASLGEGKSPVVRGLKPTREELSIGRLIEGVLCNFEVNLDADTRKAVYPKLAPLMRAGLVGLHGTTLTVSARGKPYARNVAACLDPGFAAKPSVHSLAI
jgi:oxygen-independent coproporphyrinogen-3 oxidase